MRKTGLRWGLSSSDSFLLQRYGFIAKHARKWRNISQLTLRSPAELALAGEDAHPVATDDGAGFEADPAAGLGVVPV